MANILIVDDSRTSRKILKGVLENLGHTIVGEGTDGEEGYQQFLELHPELVTLDITMPKMDGLEALQKIKSHDKDTKVIMVTAAGQKDKMIQAIRDGAAEFILKPYQEDEVERIIERVLDR